MSFFFENIWDVISGDDYFNNRQVGEVDNLVAVHLFNRSGLSDSYKDFPNDDTALAGVSSVRYFGIYENFVASTFVYSAGLEAIPVPDSELPRFNDDPLPMLFYARGNRGQGDDSSIPEKYIGPRDTLFINVPSGEYVDSILITKTGGGSYGEDYYYGEPIMLIDDVPGFPFTTDGNPVKIRWPKIGDEDSIMGYCGWLL